MVYHTPVYWWFHRAVRIFWGKGKWPFDNYDSRGTAYQFSQLLAVQCIYMKNDIIYSDNYSEMRDRLTEDIDM